jgi:acyl-CoA hydrolase
MDCHGAVRLAMTGQGVINPPLVIARHEAIHRRSHKGMDCHGDVRLAMTGQGVINSPLVIARNEAIHRQPRKAMDCRGRWLRNSENRLGWSWQSFGLAVLSGRH